MLSGIRSSRAGGKGFALWLLFHGCLYVAAISGLIVGYAAVDGRLLTVFVDLVYTIVIGLPLIIAMTMMLTAVGWLMRRWYPITFRVGILALVGIPTICFVTNDIWPLALVQVAYALVIGRPTESLRNHGPGGRTTVDEATHTPTT